MQTNVLDVSILKQTVSFLRQQKLDIDEIVNIILKNFNKKKDEINIEINISNNYLIIAKTNEVQKQSILLKRTEELSRALQQQAIALSSGSPPAIAAATMFVSKATHEKIMADNEYKKSVQNRIYMEKRFELVKLSQKHLNILFEESNIKFNSQLTLIHSFIEIANLRLNKADLHLNDYITLYNLKSNNNLLEQIIKSIDNGTLSVEKYFKTIGITDLEKGLLNDAKISRSNGKIVAKRNDTFSISYRDALGRTNKERMEEGLAPYGIDNKPIELHHLKQKDNGVMLELTNEEHKKNSKVLHRYETQSQIDRGNFKKWKIKYWKNRAKEFEC